MKKVVLKLLLLGLVLLAGNWIFNNTNIIQTARRQFFPCTYPVTYSLASIDAKFNLSNEEILSTLKEAEDLWEKPTKANLFDYDQAKGEVKVNFIFDSRQQATLELDKIGIQIKDTKDNFDSLRVKYDTTLIAYTASKADYELKLTNINKEKQSLESDIKNENQNGGADKDTYNKLQSRQAALNKNIDQLNSQLDSLNNQVAQLNSMAGTLNKISSNLNLNVKQYNKIGASNGEEFQEGVYMREGLSEHIDIFQYSTRQQLVRVLAHELGHALGMNHVDDTKAIMYKLNQSENLTPTEDDINEVSKACNQNNRLKK